MADNLTTTTTVSTIPSGTVIATDDVGGAQYQRIKMHWGANGTANETDAPTPMPIVAAARTTTITAAPTLSSGASIVTGDFVGTNATPWSWAGATRASGGTATLQTVVFADGSLQAIPCELWLFSASVTVPNDSAQWNVSDADAFKCIGVVDLSSYRSSTLNSICTVTNIGLAFTLVGSSTLYGALVARGTATYGTTALQIMLTIYQD